MPIEITTTGLTNAGVIIAIGIAVVLLMRGLIRRWLGDRLEVESQRTLLAVFGAIIGVIVFLAVLPFFGLETEFYGQLAAMIQSRAYSDVAFLDLIVAVFIVIAALFVARSLELVLKRSFKQKVTKNNLSIMLKMSRYTITIIAVLTVLPMIGVNPAGLLVAGGIIALVIGFASQSIVSNLISGIFLIAERPVQIGDAVDIGGVSGYIDDIRIMSTIVRTYQGPYVRMPNEKVFTTNVTTYGMNSVRRIDYIIPLRYGDDALAAAEIIRGVIADYPWALCSPAPEVFVNKLDEYAAEVDVRPWAPNDKWWTAKIELLWLIKRALDEAGFQTPVPLRELRIMNGVPAVGDAHPATTARAAMGGDSPGSAKAAAVAPAPVPSKEKRTQPK